MLRTALGLEEKKDIYKKVGETLSDGSLTTLILVTRPEVGPIEEVKRNTSWL